MSEAVIQALEDQVGCYRRLAKLAELQHIHVQHDETEQLLGVLKSRQTLVDRITQLETVISPAKRNWAEYVARIGADLRAKAEHLLSETKRLLEQIMLADQNDALVLQQRKINVGRQIDKASSAKQINRTYAAAAYGTRPSKMDIHQ